MDFFVFCFFSLVFGALQGLLVYQQTEYVPMSQAEWTDAALHKGGVLLYSILVATLVVHHILLLHLLPWDVARWLLVLGRFSWLAFVARILFFDPALNLARNWYAHREKKVVMNWELLTVGYSAASDRFINWLAAAVLHNSPVQARRICWLLVASLALVLL